MPLSDRLHDLVPFAVDARDTSSDRYVVLRRTRQAFVASEELYARLESGALDPSGPIIREAGIEAERLAGIGFLGGARPAPARPSSLILCLHLVHGCNLACRYCNVGHGTYGDPFTRMTPEVAKASLDLFDRMTEQTPGVPPMLMLYGGEPLLNWPVLDLAAHLFRARHASPPEDVWMVSNATLLTADRARVLRELDVLVIVSLDGPPEYHDAMRPFASGEGSHAAALRGLRHLEEKGVRHVIRSTWKPGFGKRETLLDYLRSTAREALQITVSADFDAGSSGGDAYTESVCGEWHTFEQTGYRSNAPASSAIIIDGVLRADWAPVSGCPAGDTGWSVTPSGELHPCQVAVARKRSPLGHVMQGGFDAIARSESRRQLHLDAPGPACAACSDAPFCGGPCHFSRPLRQRTHHCDTLRRELLRAFRFAARQPTAELVARYRLGLVSPSDIRALERGAALRDIAWARNKHLRPLALCPNPARIPDAARPLGPEAPCSGTATARTPVSDPEGAP